MKAIYRRYVTAALDREVPRLLPGFARFAPKLTAAERKDATLFPGSSLFSRATPEVRLFIHFSPHLTQEGLQSEVGKSPSGRCPVALSSHGPLTQPADELLEPEWLIDFETLY